MATLDIHFLDVGQGDGTFIVFPDDKTTMLVDLGSKKNASIAKSDAITFIENTLKEIKSKKIDYLFVTHGDLDHYNLLPSLVKAIPELKFGEVRTGGSDSDYSKTVRNEVFSLGDNWYHFTNGAYDKPNNPRWSIDGVNIYLLGVNNPKRKQDDKNSSSIVLMLEYGGVKVILPGDAESNVEDVILNNNYKNNKAFLSSKVLKLGHHGSKNATSASWIVAVKPTTIFASADRKWSHPYCEVLARFRKDTSKDQLELDGNTDLAQLFEHQIVCGMNANVDYRNPKLKSAVFTNIFSIVTDKKSPFYGLVLGTQYRLQVDSDEGKIAVSDLNTSSIWFG